MAYLKSHFQTKRGLGFRITLNTDTLWRDVLPSLLDDIL